MREASIGFGPGQRLVGTLCLPEAQDAGDMALGQILFNAGAVHRVGPHRINVRLARRLARRGVASLRFDLSGQGDSGAADGDLPFEKQAVADLRAAMDSLGEASGARRFSLFGFCSGGCHSYAAAQADPRIAGIILYDTYIYPTLKSRLNRYVATLRHRGVANAAGDWIRRRAAAALRRLGAATGARAQAFPVADSGEFVTPSREEFTRVVRALHARGTRVGVMYSGGFEEYNYAEQFRDAFRPMGLHRLVTSDYFPGLGHSTTEIAAQRELIDRIESRTMDLARGIASRGGRGDAGAPA